MKTRHFFAIVALMFLLWLGKICVIIRNSEGSGPKGQAIFSGTELYEIPRFDYGKQYFD